MKDLADRVYRRRLEEDAARVHVGLPRLSESDLTWAEWQARLVARLRYAFVAGRPDVDLLVGALAEGLACVAAVDAAELVRVETGSEA